MRKNYKAYFFIVILLPFIFSFSESDLNGLIEVSVKAETNQSTHKVLIDKNVFFKVYIDPSGLSEMILPDRFISVNEQKKPHQNLWHDAYNYSQSTNIFLHHPIACYKISLSVYTSDG